MKRTEDFTWTAGFTVGELILFAALWVGEDETQSS